MLVLKNKTKQELLDLANYYEKRVEKQSETIEKLKDKRDSLLSQIDEANELLHFIYDNFCEKDDCNEITDYFEKWGC